MTREEILAQGALDCDLAHAALETAKRLLFNMKDGADAVLKAELRLQANQARFRVLQALMDPLVGQALVHAVCDAQDVVFAPEGAGGSTVAEEIARKVGPGAQFGGAMSLPITRCEGGPGDLATICGGTMNGLAWGLHHGPETREPQLHVQSLAGGTVWIGLGAVLQLVLAGETALAVAEADALSRGREG